MSIKSQSELDGIKAAGEAVAQTLRQMRAYAAVGMSTQELDEYGYRLLRSYGANPAPKKDYNFPGWTCISLNHEVCHGIPSASRILRESDLVNIDVSAEVDGFYGDNGGSFILGQDIRQLTPLVRASQEILRAAIPRISDRVKIADVGGFIEREAQKRGYSVIRNLCGHGIGRRLHEAPSEIPCFHDHFNTRRFRKNSVVALETFISTNANFVYEMDDGWTMQTDDESYVAQHEHTLVITEGEPIIVTAANGIF
ncbi:MAG: type I methionyl aminopeptidase [Bacteroidota bacterium]